MNSQEILFCLSKPREIPGRVNYPLTEEDKKDIALINWIKEQKKDKHYLRSLEEVANEVLMERKIPDQVLSTLWRVSKIARRVSAVADHMSGVFISQNDIAWETEQAQLPSVKRAT